MAERDFKGVWIPKIIYLDENLNWTEKILLVEIDSLDGEKGCFASNEHFANHLMISKGRVSKLVSKLVELGYVELTLEYKNGSKEVEKRTLRATIGYSRKRLGGMVENDHPPIVENDQDNNTLINNTFNNTIYKKEKKKTEFSLLIESYTTNQEIRSTIYEFVKMRKTVRSPMTSNALKLMLTKLDKFAATDQEKKAILEQSIMNSWKGIFKLKREGENYGHSTSSTGEGKKWNYSISGCELTEEERRRAEEELL